MTRALRPHAKFGFADVVGIGGIGTGVAFALEGDHTLGREESRLGALLAARDFCKLHIVEHYIATLMGSESGFRLAAIGVVGDDAAGRGLLGEMRAAGIETQWVRCDREHPTLFSACFVYPDRSGGNITASNSAAATLNDRDLRLAADRMKTGGGRCVALCLPEVPLPVRLEFLKMATTFGNFRVASFLLGEMAAAREMGLFSMLDLVALNQEEASVLAGHAYEAECPEIFLARCSAVLTAVQPGMRIAISAGARGAHGFEDGRWSFCPALKVDAVSAGGAGDALLGGLVAGLAGGFPLTGMGKGDSALELGVALASFSVTSPDAIHFGANLDAVEAFAASLGRPFGGALSSHAI